MLQLSRTCPNVTHLGTPDLLVRAQMQFYVLVLIGSRGACARLQVGDEVPDVAPAALKGAWEATQELLRQRKISAGHDISDGGLAVALLEMAFSGNVGLTVRTPPSVHRSLFPACPCPHLARNTIPLSAMPHATVCPFACRPCDGGQKSCWVHSGLPCMPGRPELRCQSCRRGGVPASNFSVWMVID